MSKIMVLIQKSVKRFMMKAIKTDGILALIEIDRSVAKMAENKMAEVAKLFGKELGEEFTVNDKYKTEWHCKFTKRGLLYLDKTFFDWQESGDYLLQFLLVGKAVIINESRR